MDIIETYEQLFTIINMFNIFKSKYLIIILCVISTNATLPFGLPEEIYEYCPYTDICNRTASKSSNAKASKPCCSPCKCDDQCGLRLDCCFDHLDKYRLKDNGIIECINSFDGDKTAVLHDEAHWMVKSCKHESEDAQDDVQTTCVLYTAEGQSVVKPVSSKENGNIYINAECAKCNDVYNFTRWDYLFIADVSSRNGALLWELEHTLDNIPWAIVYILPEQEDWSMKRCYEDRHDFKTSSDSCSNPTNKRLCDTLQAVYWTAWGIPYKNIFCALCVVDISMVTECRLEEGDKASFKKLTLLIDHTSVEPSDLHRFILSSTVSKLHCPKGISSTRLEPCIPVYCPDGMLKTPTGCEYIILRWYPLAFQMQFQLVPVKGSEFLITSLQGLTVEERENPFRWIKLPCRRMNPTVLDVFYETGDHNKTVKSLVIDLWKLTPNGFDVKVVFPLLRQYLERKWHLQLSGNSYPFHESLYMYSNYIQDGKQRLFDPVFKELEDVPRPQLYKRIVHGSKSLQRTVRHYKEVLRKVFFCNQIRLPFHDVEVKPGEIRILSNNVTLGSNEFSVNIAMSFADERVHGVTDINRTTFSICLEDYVDSYDHSRSRSATTVRAYVWEQLFVCCIIVHLIKIYM